MSFNNHDHNDPNAVRYKKADKNLYKEDELNGEALQLYLKATNYPLKEFMNWYKTEFKKA